MKIAVLSEGRHPIYGGGQVHVEYLCKYLVQDFDASVDLFTRRVKDKEQSYLQDESLEGGKWRIYRTGLAGPYFHKLYRVLYIISFIFYFLRKAHKEKYDIIHAHALLPGLPAIIVGRLLRIPVVYTVHGSIHLDSGRKDIYYYIEKFLITKIHYSTEIFVSHQTLQYANVNKQILVIHNGVDITAFSSTSKIIASNGFCMITVGRVDWQKNQQSLINAIARIDKKKLDNAQFTLKIVGDGVLLDDCKKLTSQLGVEKYITFTGKVFGKSLIDIYTNADAFILPSLAEGQPLTILEAFAAKIPVIATDVGDNAYIVYNNKNGLLIPVDDSNALQEAIEYCIEPTHKSILQKRGEQGFIFVSEKHDWHIIVARTYEVYQNCVETY